jgi:hypothetical protein
MTVVQFTRFRATREQAVLDARLVALRACRGTEHELHGAYLIRLADGDWLDIAVWAGQPGGPRHWTTPPGRCPGARSSPRSTNCSARSAARSSSRTRTQASARSPDAVGAVLLYRIMTFKILVTIAWVGYQYLQDRARGRVR